jgi:N utilization substance protein A
MKNQQLVAAIHHLATERGLPPEVILDALEVALASAYKRNYGASGGNIEAKVDPVTGDMHVYVEMQVVEEVTDSRVQMSLPEARRLDPEAEVDGTVVLDSTPHDFGRIAAQTAKQVILQRIKEAERENTYERFSQREGEIVSGRVQRFIPRTGDVIVNIEQSEGVLGREDQLPNERYHRGSPLRAYLMEVKRGNRGTALRLSRTHRHMLRRLLESQVPEVDKGIVEIKSIAREPGYRSKVAVTALQPGVEPVGCCVGMRGSRIQHIVDELNGEKIDVIAWSADTRTFIQNALSPAKPIAVLLDEGGNGRTAVVIVPDRQLSLSIGREGQNARLAAKLTGWRIDIKGETEANEEGLLEIAQQQLQAEQERKVGLLEAVQDILREGREVVELRLDTEAEPAAVAPEAAEADAVSEDELAVAEAPEAAEVAAPEAEEAPAPEPVEEAAGEPAAQEEERDVEAAEGVVGEPEKVAEEAEAPADVDEEELDYAFDLDEEDLDEELGDEDDQMSRQREADRRRDLQRRRRVVYDEELGQTIAIRRRKRGGTDWGEEDEYL